MKYTELQHHYMTLSKIHKYMLNIEVSGCIYTIEFV